MTHLKSFAELAKTSGEENLAQWRISSAIWAGRFWAVMIAVSYSPSLLREGGPNWISVIEGAVLALGMWWAAQAVKRGSRVGAIVLLASVVILKLWSWLVVGQPLLQGALWAGILLFCFVQGVWGTFSLPGAIARQRLRDAAKAASNAAV